MKKLTAFLAIVALGLFSSLTANAQIQIKVTKVGTTPVLLSPTNVAINTANLVTPIADQVYNTPLLAGTRTFDLGYMRLDGSVEGITAGNFVLDTEYTIQVLAGAFDSTKTIHIRYNVISSSSYMSDGDMVSLVTATNITTVPLAVFAFDYDGSSNILTFLDKSSLDASREVNINGGGIPLQVGNLGVKSFLIVNPVPEPSTYALMGASGLAALAGFRRFRSKKANKA